MCIDKGNMVYIHNGMLFSLKKNKTMSSVGEMDGT